MANKFPKNWKAYKLDQLGLVGRGRSRHRPRNEPSLYDGEYPFFQTGDIKSANLYLTDYTQTYNEKGLAQSKLWEPGTLCITIAANIAETAILGIRGCFPDSVIGFIPDKKSADVRFIKYKIDMIKLDMQQVSHGTTQDNLSLEKLLQFDFIIPLVDQQRKIAAILSAYDDLIENNLRRIKILEEMAQLIYREWFVHFRFPGHEKVKMVDSPLGKIPEGWEIAPLRDVVDTQYGYTESAKENPVGPKYLRGKDINKTSYIDWSSVPYCSIPDDQFDKYKLNIGDIVLVRMADPGKVGIVEIEIDSVFASYLVRFSIKNNLIKPYYLFFFLCDDRYQGYITGASTGTTRKSASAGVLTGIDVVIPSKLIIKEFENKVFKLRKLLNNLLLKNHVLRQTRDLLLPKLISGELDVSNLDITLPEEVSA